MGARESHLVVLAAVGISCGGESSSSYALPPPSPLERALDAALHLRFGVAVATRCPFYLPVCHAQLPDGTVLPISIHRAGTDVEWRVEGLAITTDAIESYLRDELADLGAAQGVRCAPRIRRVLANDRIECWLANGGKAFITVRSDGTTSVEVALDAAAANARSEVVTPERDHELTERSRALQDGGGEEDEPAPVPAGGAPDPR